MSKKRQVFFDLTVDNDYYGKVVIELDYKNTPITAENFRCLCTGERGMAMIGAPLHYKGTKIDQITPGYLLGGGGLTTDRHGLEIGESIYGAEFKDESFENKHNRPGVITMENNNGENSNTSTFLILMKDAREFDNGHVAFGCVVEGLDVLQRVEHDAVLPDLTSVKNVVISDCGEIKSIPNCSCQCHCGEI